MERADLITTLFCLAHCVIGLMETLPLSETFRGFAYIMVVMNFFTSFINTGSAVYMPPKLWFALTSFCSYSAVNGYDYFDQMFNFYEIPDIFMDLALYQYYIMSLISLLAIVFYSETYTKPRFAEENGFKAAYQLDSGDN